MTGYRKLAGELEFSGLGLHTGVETRVVLTPREAAEGVMVSRGGEVYSLENCSFSGGGRATEVFLPDGASVKTPEHLFAALGGLGLWSVQITVLGPEVPALDGCSLAFASALAEGSFPLPKDEDPPKALALDEALAVEDGSRGGVLAAFPSEDLHISSFITYEGTPIGTQGADFIQGRGNFLSEIAPARTFALASEVEGLLDRGLAKGGSLENAILVEDDGIKAKGGLRFADEFVRHKILDLLGDLYLLGRPLRARVLAVRAGHKLHCRLVEKLLLLSRKRKNFKKGD